jgi:hypothetical protein
LGPSWVGVISFTGQSSSKQGFRLLQGIRQLIDFLHGVVEGK